MKLFRLFGVVALLLFTTYSFSTGRGKSRRGNVTNVPTTQSAQSKRMIEQRTQGALNPFQQQGEVNKNNQQVPQINISRMGRSSVEAEIAQKFTGEINLQTWSPEAIVNLNQFKVTVASSKNKVEGVNQALIEFGINDVNRLNKIKEELNNCRM